jgi:hypothetical protein
MKVVHRLQDYRGLRSSWHVAVVDFARRSKQVFFPFKG